MFTYPNRLEPALLNLLQRVVQFFHLRSSCTTTYISADVRRIMQFHRCGTYSVLSLSLSIVLLSVVCAKLCQNYCRAGSYQVNMLTFTIICSNQPW